MKIFSSLLAIAMLLSVGSLAHAKSIAYAVNPATKIVLPKDPKAAVIVLDYKGGYTPPKTNNEPAMTITADGTVLMPARFQGQDSYTGKISVKELTALLDDIVNQKKFLDWDASKIKQKINDIQNAPAPKGQLRLIPRIADAATTVLQVHLNGKENELQYYPSGIDETKVPELVQFKAITKKLQKIQSVIRMGGKEEIAKWLKQANEALKEKHPNAKPLTMDHFQSGHSQKNNGYFNISFTRINYLKNNRVDMNNRTTVSFFRQKTGAKMRINVNHKSAEK